MLLHTFSQCSLLMFLFVSLLSHILVKCFHTKSIDISKNQELYFNHLLFIGTKETKESSLEQENDHIRDHLTLGSKTIYSNNFTIY